MASAFPVELADLRWVVGSDWPETDEDALRRCADAWATASRRLEGLVPDAVVAGDGVRAAVDGEVAQRFDELWTTYAADPDGYLATLAATCADLARICEDTATAVEYARYQFVLALVALAIQLALLVAALVPSLGTSAAGIPVAVAATQITVRVIALRLLQAIASGAAYNLAVDGLAQLAQAARGHRRSWDAAATGHAVTNGAVAGAVGGGVFLAGRRFAPEFLQTRAGLVGTAGVAGTASSLAAGLASGGLPSGADALLAFTSGIAGGSPDVIHGLRRPIIRADAPTRLVELSTNPTADLDVTPGRSSRAGAGIGTAEPLRGANATEPHAAPVASGAPPTSIGPSGGSSPPAGHPRPPESTTGGADLAHRTDPEGAAPVGEIEPHPASDREPGRSDDIRSDSAGAGLEAVALPAAQTLADDEAVALARRNAFPTRSGIAFYDPDDEVRAFAAAVLTTDGYVTVDVHGVRGALFQIDRGRLAPEQFAAALRELAADATFDLPDGSGIKLLSCAAATGGPASAAARLSRALGVEVIAPDRPVWTTLNGDEIVASAAVVHGNLGPVDPPDGQWHIFRPDEPGPPDVPLGFPTFDQYSSFAARLHSGLAAAGYPSARAAFQGSSVTGTAFRTGRDFDDGRTSDYDLALAGDELFRAAVDAGVPVRWSGRRTPPLNDAQLVRLGLGGLRDELAGTAGRPVAFMIYRDIEDALRRSPSIEVPPL